MDDSLFVIDSTFLVETSRNSFYGAPLLQGSSGRPIRRFECSAASFVFDRLLFAHTPD
jgi:hypothetical protein